MSKEAQVIAEAWEIFRDLLPANQREDVAVKLLRLLEEYNVSDRDMIKDGLTEDTYFAAAHTFLYVEEEEEDYGDDDYGDEG